MGWGGGRDVVFAVVCRSCSRNAMGVCVRQNGLVCVAPPRADAVVQLIARTVTLSHPPQTCIRVAANTHTLTPTHKHRWPTST